MVRALLFFRRRRALGRPDPDPRESVFLGAEECLPLTFARDRSPERLLRPLLIFHFSIVLLENGLDGDVGAASRRWIPSVIAPHPPRLTVVLAASRGAGVAVAAMIDTAPWEAAGAAATAPLADRVIVACRPPTVDLAATSCVGSAERLSPSRLLDGVRQRARYLGFGAALCPVTTIHLEQKSRSGEASICCRAPGRSKKVRCAPASGRYRWPGRHIRIATGPESRRTRKTTEARKRRRARSEDERIIWAKWRRRGAGAPAGVPDRARGDCGGEAR